MPLESSDDLNLMLPLEELVESATDTVRDRGGEGGFDEPESISRLPKDREAYFGLTWPGKSESLQLMDRASADTLQPEPTLSTNFAQSKNLFIEGNNLEVLKLLRKAYAGKVQMIYIDPPYNISRDFIYTDRYDTDGEPDLARTGTSVQSPKTQSATNLETGELQHVRWLNMMYPRLGVARELLSDNGVIFISIDDREFAHLRQICNQIFGEANFIATLVWKIGHKNNASFISQSHEYIVCYVKNVKYLKKQKIRWQERKLGVEKIYSQYNNLRKRHGNNYASIQEALRQWFGSLATDDTAKRYRHYSFVDARGVYAADNISPAGGKGARYPLLHPITGKPCKLPSRGWSYSQEHMNQLVKNDLVLFGEDETLIPRRKRYLKQSEYNVPSSVFYKDGRAASKKLKELFGANVFKFPKDETIIQKLISFCQLKEPAIILDFFAGSASTAHAVMKFNQENSTNHRYIMVQLAEPTAEKSAARSKGFSTVAELGRKRIQLAAKEIRQESGFIAGDLGFKSFRLAPSRLSQNARLQDLGQNHPMQTTNDLPSDLIYDLLLREGYPLTSKISKIKLARQPVYSIANGALLISLTPDPSADTLDLMQKTTGKTALYFETTPQLERTSDSKTTGEQTRSLSLKKLP